MTREFTKKCNYIYIVYTHGNCYHGKSIATITIETVTHTSDPMQNCGEVSSSGSPAVLIDS